MSIISIHLEIYNKVGGKLINMGGQKYCGLNHSYFLKKLEPAEIINHLRNLSDMNETSYMRKYYPREKLRLQACHIKIGNYAEISTYQVYKFIQAISYNIEIEYLKPAEIITDSLDFLNNLLNDLKETLINTIPEYQNAQWV